MTTLQIPSFRYAPNTRDYLIHGSGEGHSGGCCKILTLCMHYHELSDCAILPSVLTGHVWTVLCALLLLLTYLALSQTTRSTELKQPSSQPVSLLEQVGLKIRYLTYYVESRNTVQAKRPCLTYRPYSRPPGLREFITASKNSYLTYLPCHPLTSTEAKPRA